jgi:AraC family transcriptional regulator
MKTATQHDYEERLLRVLVHIQTHLDDPLDMEELASLAHFSPFHFHRVFRGMVGEPVMEHVRRLRLERAAYQLKTTDDSVTRIAQDAGYSAHEAFTRAFRSMFDESPTGFRDSRGQDRTNRPSAPVHFAPDGGLTAFEPIRSDMETMCVRIERAPTTRVAFMRHVGPYDQVGATWQKFMGWAFPRGLFGPNGKILAIVHDDPEITPPEKLRYDVCITVDERFQPESSVGVQDIVGGEYAIVEHRGPYDRLGATYAALMGQWMPANDREPARAPFVEVYLNNPQQTAEKDLRTEIHAPLAPKRVR